MFLPEIHQNANSAIFSTSYNIKSLNENTKFLQHIIQSSNGKNTESLYIHLPLTQNISECDHSMA